MLCISMKAGDYFTVGGSTVIQFNRLQGDRVHLVVNAPREVPVLRGEVLERGGGQRPACVFDAPRQIVKQLPWNGEKSGPCWKSARRWTGWATAPRSAHCGRSWPASSPRPDCFGFIRLREPAEIDSPAPDRSDVQRPRHWNGRRKTTCALVKGCSGAH